jgi:hypothetical protein
MSSSPEVPRRRAGDDPIYSESSEPIAEQDPDWQRHDREHHRVAQDFDDDAEVLVREHGHRHVIAHLRVQALNWRRWRRTKQR